MAMLAALTIVGACGGSDDERRATRKPTTTTTSPAEASTTSAADASTSTSAGSATPATSGRSRPSTTATGTSGPTSPVVADQVKATQMATLTRPVALAVRPGEPDIVYVAEKVGSVRRLRITSSGVSVDPVEVMDIGSRVSTGSEQGLLGIAFAPDGNTLYVDYTDTAGDTQVVGYPFAAGTANTGAGRQVLSVDQPYPNHNGGQINFGPDDNLYVALGDGGSGGDPQNHAQNFGSLLGKILRIQPNTSASGYSIPGDNPFVGQAGKRGEIWHYGLRNPWRWSFDRATGEQWIADVGQGAYEEVNHVGAGVKGVNFGWNKREGKHAYNGGERPAGAVDPEFETTHAAGNCSITGGYVYRGTAIRGFAGTYLFADYCRGEVSAANGGAVRELGIHIDDVSSFGEDAGGELWVLSLAGGVFRLGPRS